MVNTGVARQIAVMTSSSTGPHRYDLSGQRYIRSNGFQQGNDKSPSQLFVIFTQCMSVFACVHVACAPPVCLVLRDQKKESDPLALEFWMTVSQRGGAGN